MGRIRQSRNLIQIIENVSACSPGTRTVCRAEVALRLARILLNHRESRYDDAELLLGWIDTSHQGGSPPSRAIWRTDRAGLGARFR